MKYKRKRLAIKNHHVGTMFDSWSCSHYWSIICFGNWSVSRIGKNQKMMSDLWSRFYCVSWKI